MTEIQADLIEPMKLNAAQIGERAQRLCGVLTERDLLVLDTKRASVAAKEAIEDLDKMASRLRAEIRESRPTEPVTLTNLKEGTSYTDEVTPEATA